MFSHLHPELTYTSRQKLKDLEANAPAPCLLCQVLWPQGLQHRHLIPDICSEAMTLIITNAAGESSVTIELHPSI
jgi:hypothetical protein